MLNRDVNWYLWACAEEIRSNFVPERIEGSWIECEWLKDNIEMDIKEIALISS